MSVAVEGGSSAEIGDGAYWHTVESTWAGTLWMQMGVDFGAGMQTAPLLELEHLD